MTKYNEISHFNDPQHKLIYEQHTQVPFKCNGCKEIGIGSHYKCTICEDYDLHIHCNPVFTSSPLSHPFYPKCSFQFLSRPPGNTPRICNACEREVTGFVYHCMSCGFDLHPCCAKLPMVHDVGEVKMYLYKKVSVPCDRCGKKGRSWSYRSGCKKYNLHVACVKDMLVENWHENGIGIFKSSSSLQMITTHKNNKSKGNSKVKKGFEMAGLALQFVVSAVLGDPTVMIAGVVGSIMSR